MTSSWVRIKNYIHYYMRDVITQSIPDFNSGLFKPRATFSKFHGIPWNFDGNLIFKKIIFLNIKYCLWHFSDCIIWPNGKMFFKVIKSRWWLAHVTKVCHVKGLRTAKWASCIVYTRTKIYCANGCCIQSTSPVRVVMSGVENFGPSCWCDKVLLKTKYSTLHL